MRFACDTGGTFTDLIVEDDALGLRMYKAATTPHDPVQGVLHALRLAAADNHLSLAELLGRGDMLIHGTTHAINAIITGNTAKTAFLSTAGHPDILVLREGGRIEPFNFTVPHPEPYVPRALTFEVPERTTAPAVHTPPTRLPLAIERLRAAEVEAVGVCFLWSIRNPTHELRVGELLAEHLPHVPFTLSHRLNPALREYRRASSTVIDASLKPLMSRYLGGFTEQLAKAGFRGRTLVLTSQGGMLDARDIADKPIHAINSGPSMAPIAGRHYAALDSAASNVIIADAAAPPTTSAWCVRADSSDQETCRPAVSRTYDRVSVDRHQERWCRRRLDRLGRRRRPAMSARKAPAPTRTGAAAPAAPSH